MNLQSLRPSISELPRHKALEIIRSLQQLRHKKKEVEKKKKEISADEAALLLELLKERGLYKGE